MARDFDIPEFYRSPIVSIVKQRRSETDRRKSDLKPSVIDLGPLKFKIARHFGFCFGVQNAIEIAYRALEENKDKRIFLLSEMIHNPHVNEDLVRRGVKFLMSPQGEQLIPFEEINKNDIVIVPAFGTTVELFARLAEIGIDPQVYNTTCPFVERVWKRGAELGKKGYTIVIHGKHDHEETRATFSHAMVDAPSLVVRDLRQAQLLADFISGQRDLCDFSAIFGKFVSGNFNPDKHLARIGVVNQTTMLANETQEISDLLKQAMLERFGSDRVLEHFADTRDTLCYATKENQDAITGLIQSGGDLAIIVGGYNSSNTSHLVELCEARYPTYYIKDADEIIDGQNIRHLSLSLQKVIVTENWLPKGKQHLEILVSAGASCPDALVDQVLTRIAALFGLDTELSASLQATA